jgi:tetratricopeptide (TPR) repeat protein
MVDGPARDPVLARLAPFVDHPIVGPEARLWAGLILLLEHNRPADALAQLQRASGSGDAFVGYLAHYAAGRLQEAEGDRSAAIAHYRHALARRPHTQSAVLSLSALLFARGQPDEAYALVSESLRMPDPIDPFQTYGFGTYRRFHEYLAATRRELGL